MFARRNVLLTLNFFNFQAITMGEQNTVCKLCTKVSYNSMLQLNKNFVQINYNYLKQTIVV